MPWRETEALHLCATIPHSFIPNNLASDGDSRLAFIQGRRVQCVKGLSSSANRHDFTLAYSEKLDVTSVFWWIGVERYSRPLLVLTTESSTKSPASLQIWNAARGTGSRIFRCNLNELENDDKNTSKNIQLDNLQFARGLAQASSGLTGQLLFCGCSNGSVFGIGYKEGRDEGFKRACTLRALTHPIVALAGDKKEGDFLVGSDEAGNLAVWSVEEELDRDGTNPEDYRCAEIYRYVAEDDFCTAVGIRGSVVVAGHASGYLTFHDIERKILVASVVSNAKAVTGLDVYRDKDLVLVCGEDCRVSVFGFSPSRGYRPVVHFSIALETMLTGCAISNSQRGYPRISVVTWDKCCILQYEYEKSGHRGRKRSERGARADDSPSLGGLLSPRNMDSPRGFLLGGPSGFLKEAAGECLVSPMLEHTDGGLSASRSEDSASPFRDEFSVKSPPPKGFHHEGM